MIIKKNVLDLAYEDTQLHRASRREMAGPCPRAGCHCRRDGFHVDPERNPVGHYNKQTGEFEQDDSQPPRGGFMCRGCWDPQEILPNGKRRGWGDAIDYLRHMRGLSYQEARALVIEDDATPVGRASQPRPRQANERRDVGEQASGYRSERWQETALQALRASIERLWDPRDTTALEYARSRGLTDDTIRKASLGYSLAGGIPRLIIPSINQFRIVAVYRRDLRPDAPAGERWRDVPGSGKDEFYLADCLNRVLPTVLVESAFDALTLAQECRQLVNVVATGGTNGARTPANLERLCAMPRVLIMFDADAGGDNGMDWWLSRLPNAQRERPAEHDLNEMLMRGYDLTGWLEARVDVCCVCQRPLADSVEDLDLQFYYDGQGRLFCQDHWSGSPTPDPDLDAVAALAVKAKPESDPAAGEALQRLHAFAERLNKEAFAGSCTVTLHPPGYTIDDRIRELQAERKARAWRNMKR